MSIRNDLLEQILEATNSGGIPADNFSGGLFDYNDLGTTSSPISVTGGAGFFNLTNDELGAFTNKTYPPSGVSDIWNSGTNLFDFTELSLGDMLDIRLDIDVITTSVNTEVAVALQLGIGGFDYTINWFNTTNFKTSATNKIVTFNGIYMGDANTLDNGARFVIASDKNCTVVVNGWYCKIIRRG